MDAVASLYLQDFVVPELLMMIKGPDDESRLIRNLAKKQNGYMYRTFVKRLLDLLISGMLMLLFLPVLLLVAAMLYIFREGDVFFIQKRPGLNGKIFRIFKFCTMTTVKGPDGQLLPDRERITRLGRFLRRTSIDELPQLFNVLKGDMSMVGPRPLLPEYLPLYNERQKKRHEVRPGITGLAQVKGGNALSWEERFEYDVYYVEHLSFILDCKIVLLTILLTLGLRKNSFSNVPAEKFLGTKSE